MAEMGFPTVGHAFNGSYSTHTTRSLIKKTPETGTGGAGPWHGQGFLHVFFSIRVPLLPGAAPRELLLLGEGDQVGHTVAIPQLG